MTEEKIEESDTITIVFDGIKQQSTRNYQCLTKIKDQFHTQAVKEMVKDPVDFIIYYSDVRNEKGEITKACFYTNLRSSNEDIIKHIKKLYEKENTKIGKIETISKEILAIEIQ